MGDALVMLTVPEEAIPWQFIRERDAEGREVRVIDSYRDNEDPSAPRVKPRQMLDEHPKAYWQMNIPVSAVWRPPFGPPDWKDAKPDDWWGDDVRRQAHCDAVRQSLEDFINGTLARFPGMVCGGNHFVFASARAEIVECEPIPDHVFEEAHRRFTEKFRRKRKPRPTKEDSE